MEKIVTVDLNSEKTVKNQILQQGYKDFDIAFLGNKYGIDFEIANMYADIENRKFILNSFDEIPTDKNLPIASIIQSIISKLAIEFMFYFKSFDFSVAFQNGKITFTFKTKSK